tara:strand:- start:268 stop:807 length:540 start_codon:yes stop_codon:yes gene_type:complete
MFIQSILFVTSFYPSPDISEITNQSLCKEDEQSWFEASDRNSEMVVSLCGSESLTGDDAWLQFRKLEKPGGVRYAYPQTKYNSLSEFSYSRYTRPLESFVEIKFTDDGSHYILTEEFFAAKKETPAGLTTLSVRPSDNTFSDKEVVFDLKTSSEPFTLMRLEDFLPNCSPLTGRCDLEF